MVSPFAVIVTHTRVCMRRVTKSSDVIKGGFHLETTDFATLFRMTDLRPGKNSDFRKNIHTR